MGMYTVLSILVLFLVYRELEHGPEPVVVEGNKLKPLVEAIPR
jgi:hypothetical protein